MQTSYGCVLLTHCPTCTWSKQQLWMSYLLFKHTRLCASPPCVNASNGKHLDSCRQPPDAVFWMIKSCYRDHLPPRLRNRSDIPNAPGLSVRQGQSDYCDIQPAVTLDWGETSNRSRVYDVYVGELKEGRLSYFTVNIQFERFVSFGIDQSCLINQNHTTTLGFKLLNGEYGTRTIKLPTEMLF